ncbi:MAG: hypothetical protein LBO09_02180 [Candidatus Peribacteria bacterium]|jgi:carbamoylphosphate synthase large subunit|nr:hypothetical protein [Candidatus Peribacteria bacterium]
MNSFDFSKVHFNTGLLVKECFERDIEVQYMGDPDILLASYQGHDEIITETTLSCMPYPLKYIIDDKYFSKLLLQRIGISTTLGKSFKKFELGKALLYSRNIGYPVVVKPTL